MLRYFASSVAHYAQDPDGESAAFPDVPRLDSAELVRAIERAELRFDAKKPRDRGAPPVVAPATPAQRVRHAKFGDGLLVERRGDQAVVEFPSGRRTLLLRVIELL